MTILKQTNIVIIIPFTLKNFKEHFFLISNNSHNCHQLRGNYYVPGAVQRASHPLSHELLQLYEVHMISPIL